jgi:hypothetical protein
VSVYILAGVIFFCTLLTLVTLISYDQMRRKEDSKEYGFADEISSELAKAEEELMAQQEAKDELLQIILDRADTDEGNLELLDDIVSRLAGDEYDSWVEIATIAGLDWPKRGEVVQLGAVD